MDLVPLHSFILFNVQTIIMTLVSCILLHSVILSNVPKEQDTVISEVSSGLKVPTDMRMQSQFDMVMCLI
jgi:hypothetical protein